MPTTYTECVSNNDRDITFARFALRCSIAFGGNAIGDKVKLNSHRLKTIQDLSDRVAQFELMSEDEHQALYNEEYEAKLRKKIEADEARAKLYQKYLKMLDKVKAWVPPTENHIGLKAFMENQLFLSMEEDCAKPEALKPRLPLKDWIAVKKSDMLDALKAFEERHQVESQKNLKLNTWIDELNKSFTE